MDIGEIIIVILEYVIIFGIPTASLIWLIVSAVRFAKVPKTDSELRKKRRLPLIISAVIFGILVLSFVGLMIMLSIPVIDGAAALYPVFSAFVNSNSRCLYYYFIH